MRCSIATRPARSRSCHSRAAQTAAPPITRPRATPPRRLPAGATSLLVGGSLLGVPIVATLLGLRRLRGHETGECVELLATRLRTELVPLHRGRAQRLQLHLAVAAVQRH